MTVLVHNDELASYNLGTNSGSKAECAIRSSDRSRSGEVGAEEAKCGLRLRTDTD